MPASTGQHDRVHDGVARGRQQGCREVGVGMGVARDVELDQRGRERQQHQRMQADDGEVDRQTGLAEQRCGHRDADLHRVAEHRADRAHARPRGR